MNEHSYDHNNMEEHIFTKTVLLQAVVDFVRDTRLLQGPVDRILTKARRCDSRDGGRWRELFISDRNQRGISKDGTLSEAVLLVTGISVRGLGEPYCCPWDLS
jgi:hypothetical protein